MQDNGFYNKKSKSKTMAEQNPKLCFSALKLIEQLYRDGHISAYMFRNIVNDYSNIVDISKFLIDGKEDKNV